MTYGDMHGGRNATMSRRGFVRLAGALAIAGAFGLVSLTGCSSAEAVSELRAIALVIDKGATSALADGSAECAYEVFRPLVESGGYMVISAVSSEPTIVCSNAVKSAGNSTETALESRWQKDRAFEKARAIDDEMPSAEEIDILKALKQAAGELKDKAGAGYSRTVYIASSGLQTCGVLDFTGNGPYGDILGWDFDTLLDRIAQDSSSGAIRAEALPDLTGVRVVWAGCGSLTAGAQCDIPDSKVAQIKDLWSRTLAYCGADFDSEKDFVNCPAPANVGRADRSLLPQVTPVVFDEALTVATVTFDESVLGFEPGDDIYREDDDYVAAVLGPYADALKQTGAQVAVLGTTANDGDSAGCIDLGRRRAERVKGDLVAMGVSPGQLIVCSAGYEGVDVRIGGQAVDFYADNFDDGGEWNEDVAKGNRAIHLIPVALAGDVLARFSV